MIRKIKNEGLQSDFVYKIRRRANPIFITFQHRHTITSSFFDSSLISYHWLFFFLHFLFDVFIFYSMLISACYFSRVHVQQRNITYNFILCLFFLWIFVCFTTKNYILFSISFDFLWPNIVICPPFFFCYFVISKQFLSLHKS